MSVHAMIAAAYLEGLDPSTRLVLMAVADSSDEHTREAAPGLPKLRAWSGLGKSQTIARIRRLEADGLLEQVSTAHRGRRAVWRVFPQGMPRIPHPDEVAARYGPTSSTLGITDSGPVDNPEGMGPADATQSEEMGPVSTPNGSGRPDPFSPLLQSSTRDAPKNPPARPVDSAPPARSQGSGFPGARKASSDDDELGVRRRARGAHNQPCPRHPGETVPCGRCAHAAATSDPAAIKAAQAEARRALRKNRTAPTPPTPRKATE